MNNNILIAVDAGKSSCKSVTKIQGKIERNQFNSLNILNSMNNNGGELNGYFSRKG